MGYLDAQNVEFQCVHCRGKTKEGNPRPNLARFLGYKDVQNIFALGHHFKGSKFQMFRDLSTEILKRSRVQMETFKTAKRRGIPVTFSQAQPDILYIRGRLWTVGKEPTSYLSITFVIALTIEYCQAFCRCVIDEKRCITYAIADGCLLNFQFFSSLSNLRENLRKRVFFLVPNQFNLLLI